MTNDDRGPPPSEINELLTRKYDMHAEFDRVLEDMRSLNMAVHIHMAAVLTPFVNRYLATAPQESETERKALADFISSELTRLGISFRFGNSPDAARLRLAHSHGAIRGEFQLDLLDRCAGHKRMTCSGKISKAKFYPFSLMPTPDRYGLWTDQLRAAAKSLHDSPRQPRSK